MATLYRKHEQAYLTQYAEVHERTRSADRLLPGTPGSLKRRAGTGHDYWYRVYYFPAGVQRDEFVAKGGDDATLGRMLEQIRFSEWIAEQVPTLRKLGFQVADKTTARVLVELHNAGVFKAGLVLVGTLACMAWLNELGAMAVSSRTLDIDVARGARLAFGAPISFLETVKSSGLNFTPVPGLTPKEPATSVKLPGIDGLRVDLLVPGKHLGAAVPIPELDWAAQAVPYYDYLLAEPAPAAVLAGWQCIPVQVPQAARMVWHKLYSSVKRQEASKRAKDFRQAAVLAAVLSEDEPGALRTAAEAAPESMIAPIRAQLPRLRAELASHPQAVDFFETALATPKSQGRQPAMRNQKPRARKSTERLKRR
jgi:hypothetical protein